MGTDGRSARNYDPAGVPALLGETARLIRRFGLAGTHVVIVGGLVPSLLVPDPEPSCERHIGTQDFDLCLSLAVVNGEVGAWTG
ncbi:MAG: hypothetical protein EXR77_16960 [Myxococcales bacterium]|nr:hypothetical protein [Myxococcales bacterium]